MIEAMKIGVSFAIAGDHVAKVKAFQQQIALLDKSVTALNQKLPLINAHFEKIGATLNAVAPKMQELFKSIQSTNRVVKAGDRSFMMFTGAMSQATTRAATLSHELNILKKDIISVGNASRSVARVVDPIYGGGSRIVEPGSVARSGGSGGGRHGGSGAHILGREMGGGEVGGFLAGRFLGGAPTAGLIGAIGGVMLGKSSFQAQSRFQQAVAQYAQQGFGSAATDQAVKFAINSHLAGISTTTMMQAITDAITVTRNPQAALALAPSVAQMEFANQQIYTQAGRNFTRNDEMNMLKFAELRSGTTDPNRFLKTLNLIEQGYASDAARLSSLDLKTLGRQGGLFIQNLSDRDFAGILPLVQSLGGQRVGSGLTTLQTSLFKGQNMRTGKRAVAELQRLGIYDNNGKLKSQFVDQVTHSPLDFLYQTLVPAMQAKGIKTTGQMSQEFGILFTQQVNRVLMQAIEQEPRILAQMALVPQAGGIQSNYMKGLNLPGGKIEQLSQSWDSLATALGRLTSSPITSGMDVITKFFNFLATNINRIADIWGGQPAPGGIPDKFDFSGKGGWFSGHLFSASGESESQQKETHASPTATSSATGTHTTILQIDGRTIGQIVSDYQDKMMNRKQIGLSSYSLQQNPIPVGSQYPIS